MELSRKAHLYWNKVDTLIKNYSIEKPIKSKVIERTFSLAGATVREIVHYLRVKKRRPLGMNQSGYFYARNRAELEHTINNLKSRSQKIKRAVQGLEGAFNPTEQTTIFDFSDNTFKSNYETGD